MRKFPWIDDVVWERRDTFEGEEYELEITPNDEFWDSDKMQQNVMLSNLSKVMRNLFLSLENPEEPIFFGGVSVASRR